MGRTRDIKHHYTYVIHNENSGRYYIGVRSSELAPEDDEKYMGSSKHLKAEMKEQPTGWNKYIQQTYASRSEALDDEKASISGHLQNGLCINLSPGGTGWKSITASLGRVVSDETKRKISEKTKGKEITQAHRDAISKARTGIPRPDVAAAHRGKKKSDEHKRNLSIAKTGVKINPNLTPESLARRSEAMKKVVRTKEQYDKQRAANATLQTYARRCVSNSLNWAIKQGRPFSLLERHG